MYCTFLGFQTADKIFKALIWDHLKTFSFQVDAGLSGGGTSYHHRARGGLEEWRLPRQTRKILCSQIGFWQEDLRQRPDPLQGMRSELRFNWRSVSELIYYSPSLNTLRNSIHKCPSPTAFMGSSVSFMHHRHSHFSIPMNGGKPLICIYHSSLISLTLLFWRNK